MQNLPNNSNKPSNNSNNNLPPNNRKAINHIIVILGIMSVIAALLLVGDTTFTAFMPSNESRSYSELISNAKNGKVSEIVLNEDSSTITAKEFKTDSKNRKEVEEKKYPNPVGDRFVSVYQVIRDDLKENNVKLGTGNGEVIFTTQKPSFWTSLFANSIFQTFLFLGLTLLVALILLRRLGEINNRSISFGNSRSRFYDDINQKKVTFDDVAGNLEVKQELMEIIDFLKRPEDYTKMGAKIPRGVLLVGSPGNGKTLLARAVAGEAGVPFMYVSGSEFVEMFVGVGASRVRSLFAQAKKKAPCLIFVDEIDAVGRQRGAGLGGGNDEREQTLNQILVEMDGFEAADYVIVIGATNRPDVLDPALLRPGRFDRQVTVTSPDKREREAILRLHSKNKRLDDDVDFSIIAKRTPGFSGADLQNLLNEAAILAVREKASKVTDRHIRESVEKSLLGPSLQSKLITEAQKRLTAYHEAGHALVQTILPEANKVQKITIIPRGKAAGYTFNAEKENDPMTKKRSEFLAEIAALFGGYVAEELVYGEVSTGASNDLQRATEMARGMVTKYGMSKLGPISFDQGKGMSFLGRDMMEKQNYSEESAKNIDKEVSLILDSCYQTCKKILQTNMTDLDKLANYLVDKEVIEYEEFNSLFGHLLPQ
jgi:cell division protease FtsH